jgi:hypothetical protein
VDGERVGDAHGRSEEKENEGADEIDPATIPPP